MSEEQAHRHRTRVNLIAGLFVLVLIGVAIWTVKAFIDQEKLQRCLESRRPDCLPVDAPPREGIRVPTR